MNIKEYKELFEKVKNINVYEVVFTENDRNIILLAGQANGFEPDEVTNFNYGEEEGSSLIELIFNDGVKAFEYDEDYVIDVVTDDKEEAIRIACKEVEKYIFNE